MIRRILLDTNVALRAFYDGEPQSPLAELVVRTLLESGDELFVVPQVVRETMHTLMRPKVGNGMGLTQADALRVLGKIEASEVALLGDTHLVHDEWLRIVKGVGVQGRQVHDANLAAAMRAHGIGTLLTFDARDFARYSGLTVLTPEAVLTENA